MTIATLPLAAGWPLSSSREANWFVGDRSINQVTLDGWENALELDDTGVNSFTLDQSRNSLELTV